LKILLQIAADLSMVGLFLALDYGFELEQMHT
jgi:SAM-dependent MidA family methyltransferase